MKTASVFCLAAALTSANALAPSQKPPSTAKVAQSAVAAAVIFGSAVAPANAVPVAKGEKLFEANCAACHAAGKQLNVKEMSLQKDALLKGPGLSQIEIENYLKEGFPHAYMPFKLKAQGYSEVVSYVLDNALNDKWGENQ